jgi:uncharacterized membrane protein YgcG
MFAPAHNRKDAMPRHRLLVACVLALASSAPLVPAGRAVRAATSVPADAPGAAERQPRVRDDGRVFGEEAVGRAEGVIRDVKERFGKDVVVETYPAVPEAMKGEYDRLGREKFFDAWLGRRARELGVNGVFILIVRQPGRIQVGVGRRTRQFVFPLADREALREMMAERFRAKDFDRGLVEGLEFIRRRMEENTKPEGRPASVPV